MRIALGVEYEGANYSGFQRQKHAPSVQGELERALSIIADEKVELYCAGRTDAGVNATGQVVHFDISKERSDRAFVLGTNVNLPDDIAVTWAKHVSDDFHARFSAKARRYRYILQNTDFRPGIMRKGVSLYRGNFDVQKMQDASSVLIGEHDFASFKSSQDESLSSYRCVNFINITRRGPYIIFDIEANAFLHHMVRNIVGTLLMIGDGQKDKNWLIDIFKACDRNLAGPTAFGSGLYLVDVTYPDNFCLPKREYLGPLWF